MNALQRVARAPAAAVEFANILLTQDSAETGTTPRDQIWTHRSVTLYRYRSDKRTHPIPVLLVFALINRPYIFDLRGGHSFVEFLLDEGYDVFLVDWGYPGPEDADMGITEYACDELPWAIRETLRASGQDEVSLLGWCIGGALCTMHTAMNPDGPARNLVLLTTPIDGHQSRYAGWVGRESFDVERIAGLIDVVPGRGIDLANKLMKPVDNFWTSYRQLWEGVLEGKADREAFQSMSKWISDNPDFPSKAFEEWIQWIYKDNRLVDGRLTLRGEPVRLEAIRQSTLVITASSDHITPRPGTMALVEKVGSDDLTHFDRPGGHIGLMAGSRARKGIWPDIAEWLAERSQSHAAPMREETHVRS